VLGQGVLRSDVGVVELGEIVRKKHLNLAVIPIIASVFLIVVRTKKKIVEKLVDSVSLDQLKVSLFQFCRPLVDSPVVSQLLGEAPAKELEKPTFPGNSSVSTVRLQDSVPGLNSRMRTLIIDDVRSLLL
jgi:hypothetical protein